MAVHTWDRGGANSAWNRRPCSRRNYPEIFTRLHPLRADSSPSVALICLAGRQPGKLRTSRAIWYRDYLFVLMNRASFEFSPLSLSRISGLTLEILQLERFEEGELRKRFESLTVLKYIFVCNNRWMKRCYDLKYFFDILRKCERTRRGLYSKTSLTEKRVRKEGTWNFSRSFFPPLINDFFSTSLLRASSRNYYTKRSSVVKIRRKKDVEIEKRERERERKFVMITERFNL